MNKKYIARLSKKEREQLDATVKSLKGASQKARRARILLQADVCGRPIQKLVLREESELDGV